MAWRKRGMGCFCSSNEFIAVSAIVDGVDEMDLVDNKERIEKGEII
jgi:hypothetical protein